MFIDYQQLVFQDYQRKKTSNAISPRLMNPSPAEIRKECIAVCRDRYSKKDEVCLMRFFGKHEDKAAYMEAIENHPTNRFKPLVNYLKGKVGTTEHKNTELLSWLINFEPRPFEYGKRYIVGPGEEEIQMVGEQIEEDHENNGTEVAPGFRELNIIKSEEMELQVVGAQIEENNGNNGIEAPPYIVKKPRSNFKLWPGSILILLIISAGAWFYLLLKPDGPQGCMYWADDHYEPVSCNQKFSDRLVLALDSVKLLHFKRITEPDTITGKSKGSVWYVKVNDRIEFYTSDGFHPVQLEKRLRPVTDYIIYKYVYQK